MTNAGKARKRIALVVNTLSGGGAEKTVSNLSQFLSSDYDVDIVLNDTAHIDYPYAGQIISLDMPEGRDRSRFTYQIAALLKRVRILRKLKKENRYAAVISFSELTNVSNVLSGNKYGKTIVSFRVSVRERMSLQQRLIAAFICKKADMTVSCSREIADDLQQSFGLRKTNSRVVYNGIDLQRIKMFSNEPLTEDTFEGKKLIVTVGRLTAQKGQRHLLRAVKHLLDRDCPVHLLILGEGELRSALEEEAKLLGISEQVSMPGFVENPYRYIAKADVFVMPSMYEGFSNAILEALACGVPVVSTDHNTGAREILAPDTDYHRKVTDHREEAAYGILVPVCEGEMDDKVLSREETILAETILRLLTEPDLTQHYRRASLERSKELRIERICEEWAELIEE